MDQTTLDMEKVNAIWEEIKLVYAKYEKLTEEEKQEIDKRCDYMEGTNE